MEPWHLALRGAVAYAWLLLGLRLSGKRTVSESSAFDFVLALVLGDLVDDAVYAESPASQFVVASGALLLLHGLVSAATCRWAALGRWVNGSPVMVIEAGRVQGAALGAEHVSRDELAGLLRLAGVDPDRLGQIREARIEDSGDLSVLR